jgi:hypothetical protein
MAALLTYPHPQTFRGSTGLPGVEYRIKWRPIFFNQSFKAMNGAQIDIGLAGTPLHEFELSYSVLRNNPPFRYDGLQPDGVTYNPIAGELRRLLGFYMMVGGQLGRFAFDNTDDDYIKGQVIAITDGVKSAYQLVRTLADAAGPSLYNSSGGNTEPIGLWNDLATFNVYLDSGTGPTLISPVSYSVTNTPGNVTVTFTSAPPAGETMTVDMGYYYYCKFATDMLEFEKIMDQRWMNPSIKLQSCRAGA